MDEPALWMNLRGHALDFITDANLGSFRAILLQIKPKPNIGFGEVGIHLLSWPSANILICGKN